MDSMIWSMLGLIGVILHNIDDKRLIHYYSGLIN